MTTTVEIAKNAIVHDELIWSLPTMIMCGVGWWVHWLSLYSRAFYASQKIGTRPPSVWLYWYGDWPATLKAALLVSAGYFLIPEIGLTWPSVGVYFGVVTESGEIRGLSLLSAFLWGVFGAMFGDIAGKRLAKLME